MKTYLYRLLLSGTFFCMPLLALVNPIEGENLWRMVSRIGFMVDQIFLDQLSIGDVLCSKIEAVDDNLLSVGDVLCSKLEMIDDDLLSVGDVLCSKIEGIQDAAESGNDLLCSKLEMVNDDVLSVGDVLCSKIEFIGDMSSQLDVIEDKIDLIQCPFTIVQDDIPLTITQPGHYCLLEDVSGTNNLASLITIDSDDVRLDLAQRRITPGLNTSAIEVVTNHARIKIFDGSINHSAAGLASIFVNSNVSDLTFDNLCIDCDTAVVDGIAIAGSAQKVVMRDCSIVNALSRGINCVGGDTFCLENIDVAYSGSDGVAIAGADSIFVTGCKAYNNGSSGFDLEAHSAVISDSIAELNGSPGYPPTSAGFFVQGNGMAASCRMSGCTTNGNQVGTWIREMTGKVEGCKAAEEVNEGFFIDGCTEFHVQGCYATGCTNPYPMGGVPFLHAGMGFHIAGAIDLGGIIVPTPPLPASFNCHITGCVAIKNASTGFMLDESAGVGSHRLFDNYSAQNGVIPFENYNQNGLPGVPDIIPHGAFLLSPGPPVMLPDILNLFPSVRVNLAE